MRPSLRFLGIAVAGWATVRAATMGALPGAEIFHIDPSEAKVPPIVATQFPSIEPVQPAVGVDPATDASWMSPGSLFASASGVRYVQGSVGVPVALRPGVVTVYQLPPVSAAGTTVAPPRPVALRAAAVNYNLADYSVLPPLDPAPLSRIASFAPKLSRPTDTTQTIPAALKRGGIDRLQLTAWALLRAQSAGAAGSQSLASGGSLGASQAGSRLTYNFTRQIAATMRTSSDVGRRGGEAAAGVRIQPVANIPLWIDAERRQRIGRYGGGRSAFALFFEGGFYDRPMPLRFLLDAYLQGGVVGIRRRDGFIDGGLTLTRPVYKRFSAGFGVWGGAQPGLYRVDAGPRVTMRVRDNLRVHFDWRQRLAGNAAPGSGPAITLAGDF
ncbi:MAG TPA: hypothetical protein VGM04_00420 [Sphingomicrobium sp.]|jgi:hypothetical protein